MSRNGLYCRLLRRQNARLRRENRALRRRLAAARRTADGAGAALPRAVRSRFHRTADTGRRLNLHSYPAYLRASLHGGALGGILRRVLTAARRYRMLTAVLRCLALAAAWLETGAVMLIYGAVLLAVLPLLLAGGPLWLLILHRRRRRCAAELGDRLAGRRVLVCFADRDALSGAQHYFCGMVRAFASAPSTAVLVISPYLCSGRGIGSRRFYLTFRRDAPPGTEIYLVRRHAYFFLRRRVLNAIGDSVILLH